MPFNDMGEAVKRGMSSIDSKATRDQIADKVFFTAGKAGMGKIVSCDVTHQDGTHISTWDLRNDGQIAVQCDGEGSLDFENSMFLKGTIMNENTTNTGDIEADLAAKKAAAAQKKAEAQAAAEAKKAEREATASKKKEEAEAKKAERAAAAAAKKAEREAGKAPKGPTKKDRVHGLMQRAEGVTIDQIVAELGVGDTAARSLVNDVKRAGKTVTSKKDETTKVVTWHSPAEGAAETEAPAPEGEGDAADQAAETETA